MEILNVSFQVFGALMFFAAIAAALLYLLWESRKLAISIKKSLEDLTKEKS